MGSRGRWGHGLMAHGRWVRPKLLTVSILGSRSMGRPQGLGRRSAGVAWEGWGDDAANDACTPVRLGAKVDPVTDLPVHGQVLHTTDHAQPAVRRLLDTDQGAVFASVMRGAVCARSSA
jgi:hypothetical protein